MREKGKIGYYIVVMASIVVVLAGVKSAVAIVVPFLLSLFIAIILSPLYSFLHRKGVPSIVALALTIIPFLVFLALVAGLIGDSVQDFSSKTDFYSQKLSEYYLHLANLAASYGIKLPVAEFSKLLNTAQIMKFVTRIIRSMGSLFTNGFVVILTVVFILLEFDNFIEKIVFANRDGDARKQIDDILGHIKSYMVIKAAISLLTGLVVWLGLLYIGTDYAFLWGVLAFVFNFIPNIGSIIAAVPAILITLVQLGGVDALLVAGFYFLVNILVGSVLEPRVMGEGVGLSTLVVFLSLLFWGWLLGLVGMLLSIPLTIMAKIAFNANAETRWLAVLLGNEKETLS
jgi:predicted PurR-regulated permease PerM